MSYHQGPPYSPSSYYSPPPLQSQDHRAGPPYLTQTSHSYSRHSPASPAAFPSSSAYPQLQHPGGNRIQHRSSILPSHLRPGADTARPLLNIGNNATHATVYGRNIHIYDEDTTFRLSEADFYASRKPGWVKEGEELVFGDGQTRNLKRPSLQRHFEGIQRLTIVGGTFTVGVRRVDYVGPEADRAGPGERYGGAQREIDEAAKEVERRLDASRARRARQSPQVSPHRQMHRQDETRSSSSYRGFRR